MSSARRRVLAEARAEERRPAHLGDDELLDLVRVDEQLVGRRRRVGVRQVERDAVVRPDRLRLEPERRRAAARASAIAHGACTRAPNGVRMQTRQSPISSRKRSTTTVRSDGTAPVAACLLAQVREQVRAPRARRAW